MHSSFCRQGRAEAVPPCLQAAAATAIPHQLSIAFGRKLFYTATLAEDLTTFRERGGAQDLVSVVVEGFA